MSFILDALRKSEHERQRSAVPGLSHVPLAAARREVPGWTLVLIGALGAAVLALGGAWWQSQRSLRAPAASSPAAVAAPVDPTPAAAATPAPVTAPSITTPPPTASPATVAVATPPAQAPVASTSLQESESAVALDERTQSLANAAFVPKQPTPTGPTLPSVTALQAQGINVPPLRLELHAYSERPAERFVFINGRKYKEGERLNEGPEVVRIEANGVVLSQQGQRFQLAAE